MESAKFEHSNETVQLQSRTTDKIGSQGTRQQIGSRVAIFESNTVVVQSKHQRGSRQLN